MTAEEFANSEGFTDTVHFPMMHVSGLMERYAKQEKIKLLEKVIPKTCLSPICTHKAIMGAIKELETLKKQLKQSK